LAGRPRLPKRETAASASKPPEGDLHGHRSRGRLSSGGPAASYFFFDLRAGFREAFFATLRLPRFAVLRAGFLAAALRTVERRFVAFLFLFAVIGIETTPST
jgi:hypothetical protein